MEAIAGQAMDDRGVALAARRPRRDRRQPLLRGRAAAPPVRGRVRSICDEDGRWVVPDESSGVGLPDGVREVIDARVVRLGRASAANLSLAAVLGRDFDLDLLLAAAETTPTSCSTCWRRRPRWRWCGSRPTVPGWYSFCHALIQRTLYEGLGASRRALLHRKVFDVLAQWDERGPGSAGRRSPPPSWPATWWQAPGPMSRRDRGRATPDGRPRRRSPRSSPTRRVRWYGGGARRPAAPMRPT